MNPEQTVDGAVLAPSTVRPVWFHTVGVGQYFGTVKWHRFEDCGHLRKKRPHWSGPVKRWTTTEEYTRVDDRDESEVPESRRCKICERRYRPNSEYATEK